MTTVVLAGGDGAGKTTVARRLVASSPVPIVYLYMGPNIESSNVALPWSRLVLRLKLRSYRKTAEREGITDPSFVSTHHNAHRKVKRGPVGATLRMLNRLAEAGFRQAVSTVYQWRGYVVLYDRHFLLEAAPSSGRRHRRHSDRIYHWVLSNLFPRPDGVIFLDAPAEVLLARKGEGTIESLEWKRRVTLDQGRDIAGFVTVDATKPLEDVLAEVRDHVVALRAGTRRGHS
jgi:thymidylate kinase